MSRIAKRLFRPASKLLTALISTGIAVAVVIKHWRKLSAADLVIIHGNGGFGYTISTTDIVRRERPGQRIVILFAHVPGTHNLDVYKIWPDVDLIFVPLAFRKPFVRQFHPDDPHARTASLFPFEPQWRYVLFNLIEFGLRILLSSGRVISDDAYYRAIPEEKIPAGRPPADRWHPFYFRLFRDVPAKRLQLPDKERNLISDALRQVAGGDVKRCCLYLRLRASKDRPDAYLRSGGGVAEYSRAVKCLNDRGYQVLLVGDRNLPPGMMDEFNGMFTDADSLRVPASLFYLYAATESDLLIGETGGGFQVGPVNGIPCLLMNVYPFHIGWPEVVLYFKALAGKDGTLLPAETIFSQYGEEVVHMEQTVVDNCAAEVEAAVTHFVNGVESGATLGVPAQDVAGIKSHFFSVAGQSHVSPIWLSLYGTDGAQTAEDRAARAEEMLRQLHEKTKLN